MLTFWFLYAFASVPRALHRRLRLASTSVALLAFVGSACAAGGDLSVPVAASIASSSDQLAPSGPPSASSAAAAEGPTNVILGIQQSGTGWTGSVNIPATSANYEAMSLDALLSSGSYLAKELAKHPDIEAALRKVASETGVPAGLLAGLCYQESSFDVAAVSQNPEYDEQDVGLTQAPRSAFDGDTWKDPATNIGYFAKGFLADFKKYKSWGIALRMWNSGEFDPTDLSKLKNRTDPDYIVRILGTHCLGKNPD